MVTTDYKVVEDPILKYRLVFPIKNRDGSINWFNLLTGGSWGRLIITLLICAALVASVFIYKHDVSSLVECCNKYYECTRGLVDTGINSQLREFLPTP